MTESVKEIVGNLADDTKYYGEYGQQFLSNSDILNLLKFPEKFKVPQAKTKSYGGRKLFSYCDIGA